MKMFKTLILINLALILISLGSGIVYLVKDDGNSRRVLNSLTIRIALSVTLFLLLIIGYYTGEIQPHGI
jgi:hypothetical protein